jgi:hypothetical protein
MKKQILAMMACLACASAQAEFRTGNKLLDEMVNGSTFANGLALGYIMGVTDATGGTNHCPPASVTAGQIQDMVKATLVDAPAIRHLPASAIIEYTLNKAWPCAKGKSL